MFAFDRSALAVLLPLAMLVAVVLWSRQDPPATRQAQSRAPAEVPAGREQSQTVAANLPSR